MALLSSMNCFPMTVAAMLALAYCHPMQASGASASTVYIGTYTGERSQGIYCAAFDAASGKIGAPELAAKTPSPSFLAWHPSKPVLYAVGEASSIGPRKEGSVSAFALEDGSRNLRLLNEQTSGGSAPCHLAMDPSGSCLLVANYTSGSVAAFPVENSGRLGPASSVVQHHGSSVDPQRQKGPHAHHVLTDPANRFALVCDLGLDQVLVYELNAAKATLGEQRSVSVAPGAGPRHLAFHPQGDWVYLINEMGSSIIAFSFNREAGSLEKIQTVSTLPSDYRGQSSCAEIEVHPNGDFVYGSNRGHDSIVAYRIDRNTGTLSLVEHTATEGKTPRHFAIHPSGKWLLAANQDSDSIVVFSIDLETGKLSSTGQSISVGKPVCLLFSR